MIKNFNRKSKYDPLVEEVELLESNPEYAFVRFPDGRETSVSLKHLAPTGDLPQVVSNPIPVLDGSNLPDNNFSVPRTDLSDQQNIQAPGTVRRTSRIRREPTYLEDYVRN